MPPFCISALRTGNCHVQGCKHRHDVGKCLPCGRFFQPEDMAAHTQGWQHKEIVARGSSPSSTKLSGSHEAAGQSESHSTQADKSIVDLDRAEGLSRTSQATAVEDLPLFVSNARLCEVCRVYAFKDFFQLHTNSKQHREAVAWQQSGTPPPTPPRDCVYCQACNRHVEAFLSEIHFVSAQHYSRQGWLDEALGRAEVQDSASIQSKSNQATAPTEANPSTQPSGIAFEPEVPLPSSQASLPFTRPVSPNPPPPETPFVRLPQSVQSQSPAPAPSDVNATVLGPLISVSAERGFDFGAVLQSNDESFPQLTLLLEVENRLWTNRVGLAEIEVQAPEDASNPFFAAIRGDSWFERGEPRLVAVSFAPHCPGRFEANLCLVFHDEHNTMEYRVIRLLRGAALGTSRHRDQRSHSIHGDAFSHSPSDQDDQDDLESENPPSDDAGSTSSGDLDDASHSDTTDDVATLLR